MSVLKLGLWAFIGVLGAGALAIVSGLVSAHEKVNGLWLVIAAACIYVLAYRFYGRWLACRVASLDNHRLTPAVRLNDGVNFHPTNRVVLFGHHFAAIAGAGPLLGPVLAAQFGFLPGFLWLVIGAVLAGAVQDFIILVASMRRNGRSLPEIARDELGTLPGGHRRSGLVHCGGRLGGIGLSRCQCTVSQRLGDVHHCDDDSHRPIHGILSSKASVRERIGEVSVVGVTLLHRDRPVRPRRVHNPPCAVVRIRARPRSCGCWQAMGFSLRFCPAWMLLVPRGYLSTFMKLGVVVLLGVGVVLMAPTMEMPRMTVFAAGGGPIIPGASFRFSLLRLPAARSPAFMRSCRRGRHPR